MPNTHGFQHICKTAARKEPILLKTICFFELTISDVLIVLVEATLLLEAHLSENLPSITPKLSDMQPPDDGSGDTLPARPAFEELELNLQTTHRLEVEPLMWLQAKLNDHTVYSYSIYA